VSETTEQTQVTPKTEPAPAQQKTGDTDAYASALRSITAERDALARDFYGKWTAGSGPLWRDFSVQRHVLVHEARDFIDLSPQVRAEHGAAGHVDITARALRLVFGTPSPHFRGMRAGNTRYILGQDVNVHPLSTVALQVSAPEEAQADRDLWHYWIFETVQTYQGNSYVHVSITPKPFLKCTPESGIRSSCY